MDEVDYKGLSNEIVEDLDRYILSLEEEDKWLNFLLTKYKKENEREEIIKTKGMLKDLKKKLEENKEAFEKLANHLS